MNWEVCVIGVLGNIREEHSFKSEHDRDTWITGFLAAMNLYARTIKPRRENLENGRVVLRMFY